MSTCREVEQQLVCFVNAAGDKQTLVMHNVIDANGAVYATAYLDQTGAPVDTSGGTVTVGACPVASPDVQWDCLCDTAADGTVTPIMCRTVQSFDAQCQPVDPVAISYFAMDKVTAHVPSVGGTIGKCATECPDEVALGVITDLSLLG